MYSYGPPHMAGQKQDDQYVHTLSSYVRIQDVALKTCQRWWTIGKSGERGSGISVLVARHDDDDEISMICWWNIYFFNILLTTLSSKQNPCTVSRGRRIHWLLLCSEVRPSHDEYPRYDTKQFDGEIPVMLGLWGIQSTPSLRSFPGPLWPRVGAPDKSPMYGLNRTKLWFLEFTVFCI